eukprot:14698243-Alexandrium_andersonii.AAC.1
MLYDVRRLTRTPYTLLGSGMKKLKAEEDRRALKELVELASSGVQAMQTDTLVELPNPPLLEDGDMDLP